MTAWPGFAMMKVEKGVVVQHPDQNARETQQSANCFDRWQIGKC